VYYTYILRSKIANKTYVGYTDKLKNRLRKHNSGRSSFTRRYKPWEIIYSEKHKTREEAIRREKYLKSAAGRRWIKKFLFDN